MIEGQFSRAEVLLAWTVAGMRVSNVVFDRSGYGTNGQPHGDWTSNVNGALGELAASLAFNLGWTGLQKRGCPDVGGMVEVRAVTKAGHRLIIQLDEPETKPATPFVLVDLCNLPGWRIIGWVRGSDARRDDWRDDPVGGRPAYWVPREALYDCAELHALLHSTISTRFGNGRVAP